jgi:hypothetical protein
VLVFVPAALAFLRVPSDVLNVGSNSIAISAACHVSPKARATSDDVSASPPESSRASLTSSLEETHSEYSLPLSASLHNDGSDCGESLAWGGGRQASYHVHGDDLIEMTELIKLTENGLLEQISQSKIRWGVIRMPAEFYNEYDCAEPYEHLGFGVEGDEISSPQYGKYYA